MKNLINIKKFIILVTFLIAVLLFQSSISSNIYKRALNESIEKDSHELKNGAAIPKESFVKPPPISEPHPKDDSKLILKNIKVFAPIMLIITLILAVYFTATMDIPKNTVLYAAYVTSGRDKKFN